MLEAQQQRYAIKKLMKNRLNIIACLTTVILASTLYLQMCTASLYENYQVGISNIRFFHPGLLLLLIISITIFSPERSRKAVYSFSFIFGKLAICVCLVFAILYFVFEFIPADSQWKIPSERTLITTIFTSLTHPDFSNRSLGGLIYTVILSIFLTVISKRKLKNCITTGSTRTPQTARVL
jgi:hypothetical protein